MGSSRSTAAAAAASTMHVAMAPFVVVGTLVDSMPDWSLRIQERAFLVVDAGGTIVDRGEDVGGNLKAAREKCGVIGGEKLVPQKLWT